MTPDPVFCNPIDLPYRYQHLELRDYPDMVWREGADPSLVLYRDRYYLFVSKCGGFWHSDDLVGWEFVATPELPIDDYAPDVREIDGALVVTASRHDRPCSFWRTHDPLSGRFEEILGTFAFWDPCLFQDDDGRVYLYWGCEPDGPIRGIELDRATFQPIGDPQELFRGDHRHRGWERKISLETGTSEGDEERPWIEGAWMTKHAGRYYLQYAAPGTQVDAYADGCFLGTAPLGPFEYDPSSPFSSVPGGYAPGAGHGSTIQDRYGNWWHAATIRISTAHVFERRVGVYPAGFDETGALFCDQRFADHPIVVPQRPADPWTDTDPGWRLLSQDRPVTATSTAQGTDPGAVVDEDIRTLWAAAEIGPGHGVTLDVGDGSSIEAIQVNLADHDLARRKPSPSRRQGDILAVNTIHVADEPTPYIVETSAEGTEWQLVGRNDRDSPHRLWVLDVPSAARFVRVTGGPAPWNGPFALRGVRVFGHRTGVPPLPALATARRMDPRAAHVTWTGEGDDDGVNVRYGLAPDRLHHCWRVRGRRELVISTLSAGMDYWVAVDRFNGSGVTAGVPVPVVS